MSEPSKGELSSFDRFMLAEHEHIARAHFNTVQTLSDFFKHYLVIVSLPAPLVAVFLTVTELRTSGVLDALRAHPFLPGMALTVLVVVGIGIMCYMINLRHDALLYARTVNGIRSYFADVSGPEFEEQLRYRVLPHTTEFPRYYEPWYLRLMILALGALHSLYFGAGWWLSWKLGGSVSLLSRRGDWVVYVAAGAVFLLHFLIYWLLSRYRERWYLRQHIIGIDVDGVLNLHREHFCQILACETGREIDPRRIDRIPVHECRDLMVTQDDEHAVFHNAAYWTDMPVAPDAAYAINRLRNTLGYRIDIFTLRDWPLVWLFPHERRGELMEAWGTHSTLWRWLVGLRMAWRQMVGHAGERWQERGLAGGLWQRLRLRPIGLITRSWLKRNQIPFDRFQLETGNVYTMHRRLLTRNRFVASAERRIQAFVEDDLDKAIRLAGICGVVFLIDQPYNRPREGQLLPRNLIRAESWTEIWRYLRRLP